MVKSANNIGRAMPRQGRCMMPLNNFYNLNRFLEISGFCGSVLTVQIFHLALVYSVLIGESETSKVACWMKR